MEKKYKLLFKQQQVIINRIKKDFDILEKMHNEIKNCESMENENMLVNQDDEKSEDLYLSSENEDSDDYVDEYVDLEHSNVNMSNNLRIGLGWKEKNDFDNNFDELPWTPPTHSGLDNSEPLIKNTRK